MEQQEKDIEAYLPQAEAGNPVEQYRVGLMYYYGNGVEQNYKTAVKWFDEASKQGYLYAQTSLAVCCRRGEGILVNYMEAVKLFTQSARRGDIVAIYNLGICYYQGQGVSQDYQKAADLFREAAEQGNISERHSFGGIAADIAQEPTDREEALRLYREAAVRIDNLNEQLKQALLSKDGASFSNDVNMRRIEKLSDEKKALEETKERLEKEIAELEKQIEDNKSAAEKAEQEYRQNMLELMQKTKEQDRTIEKAQADLQESCEKADEQLKTITEQGKTIAANEETIERLNREISSRDSKIAKSETAIEEYNNTISDLKKQKPFIRKVNVLRAVDIMAFATMCEAYIVYAGRYGGMLPLAMPETQAALGAVILIPLLLFCLAKRRYGLHSVLCLLLAIGTCCIFVGRLINYMGLSGLLASELANYVHEIFPYCLLLLWSAFASLKKEIYVSGM